MTDKKNIDEYKKVGVILKEARLAKKLEIADIADKTNISEHFLLAIENDDFSALPVGAVYASGFVRTYAKFLGLDVWEIYDRFKAETAGHIHTPIKGVMEPEADGTRPDRKIILIAIAVAIAAYLLWSLFGCVSENADNREAPVLTQAETSSLSSVAALTEAEPQEEETAQVVVKEGAFIPSEPETVSPASDALVPALAVKTQKDKPVSYGAADGKTRVVLVATKEVWVQVERPDEIIISRILVKGDRYNVPDNDDTLTLRAGSGDGLDVFVDGEKVAPLGRAGAIVRNVKIDAESLLDRD